jgi:nitroreductase
MAKSKAPSYETQALREFAEVLTGRRTINLFLDLAVPDALIREAVEVATWAPNHHVTEPWQFYLLGPETAARCVDLVRELTAEVKGEAVADFKAEQWSKKPGWLVVTCKRSDDALLQQEDYGACCAAVQNLLLYLWKADVGTKWTSGPITRHAGFLDLVGIDADTEFVVGLIWYGHAKITPQQQRKALDDVLNELP